MLRMSSSKAIFSLFCTFLIINGVFSTSRTGIPMPKEWRRPFMDHRPRVIDPTSPWTKVFRGVQGTPNLDLCPLCVQFSTEALNVLLNIILDVVVVQTCDNLCEKLAERTGSEALGVICTLLCDIEGLELFVEWVEKSDLDVIYFCELIDLCAVFDDGDARFTSLLITPAAGPQGTTFQLDLEFTSLNGTGTGELHVHIDAVDGLALAETWLVEPQAPGNYTDRISIEAKPDPRCDPFEEICEMWLPGQYNVTITLCNGECFSEHPHSEVYDQKQTHFTVTDSMRLFY